MDTSLPTLPSWSEPFTPDTSKPLSATPELLQHSLGLRPWTSEQDYVALVKVSHESAKLVVQPSKAGADRQVEFSVTSEPLSLLRTEFGLDDDTLGLVLGRFAVLMAPMYRGHLVVLTRMYEAALLTTVRRALSAIEEGQRLGTYCELDTGRILVDGQWYSGVPAVAEALGCTRWVLNERMRTHGFSLVEAMADIRSRGVAPARAAQPAEVDGKVFPSVREAMRSLGYRGTWELPRLLAKGTIKLLQR